MSELKIKNTVRPRCLVIAAAVINAANEMNLPVDMLVTSGNDSTHMKGSHHYTGNALDFRSKHLSNGEISSLLKIVRRRLGKSYQAIVESIEKPNEHIHIEYDPE